MDGSWLLAMVHGAVGASFGLTLRGSLHRLDNNLATRLTFKIFDTQTCKILSVSARILEPECHSLSLVFFLISRKEICNRCFYVMMQRSVWIFVPFPQDYIYRDNTSVLPSGD